jgi:hypothetical protein
MSRMFKIYKIYLVIVLIFDVLILLPGAFDPDPKCISYLGRWVDYRPSAANESHPAVTTSLWACKWSSMLKNESDKAITAYHNIPLSLIFVSLSLTVAHLIFLRKKKKYQRRTSLAIALANVVVGLIILNVSLGPLLSAVSAAHPEIPPENLNYSRMGSAFFMFCITFVLNIFAVIFALSVLLKRDLLPENETAMKALP